jgi:hypothetical protein
MLGDLLFYLIVDVFVGLFLGSIYKSIRYVWRLIRNRYAAHPEGTLTHI